MNDQPAVNTSAPHSARVWNYWLGGKDNYPADRAVGDQVREIYPEIVEIARASRIFLSRTVTYLTREAGVRQFLDVGTGLPTAENTHDVAQQIAPTCRVVYVDNDPLVLVYARALLTSSAEGMTAYIDADVRDPEKILDAAAQTLDFDKPIALMLLGIMGHVTDDADAYSIVRRLLAPLAPGSYLVLNDGTSSPRRIEAQESFSDAGGVAYVSRTPEQVAAFFDGLELVEPGVVSTPLWRPALGGAPVALDDFAGIGKKPDT